MKCFENLVTRDIMQIKTNIENGDLLSVEGINMLLASYLEQIKTIKVLEKQLDYALETGGKYLKVEDNIN